MAIFSEASAPRNFIVPKKWNCHEDTIGEDVEWERSQGFKKNVMVAIPAYNEEVAIGSVVLRARKYADKVVVVDDGSVDRTAEIARYKEK